MDKEEQVKDINLLKHKVDGMEKQSDLKYASTRDLSDLTIKIHVQEEKIKALEQRLNDYIASRKWIITTGIGIGGLIISLIFHYVK